MATATTMMIPKHEFAGELQEVLEWMMAHYPGQTLDIQSTLAYHEALAGTNIVRLRAAVETLVRESTWPPRPAQILEGAFHFQSVRIEPLRDRVYQLRQRYAKTGEIPVTEIDALHRELRRGGYWELAAYLRRIQERMEQDQRSRGR